MEIFHPYESSGVWFDFADFSEIVFIDFSWIFSSGVFYKSRVNRFHLRFYPS